jgi:hypothetical protein
MTVWGWVFAGIALLEAVGLFLIIRAWIDAEERYSAIRRGYESVLAQLREARTREGRDPQQASPEATEA